MKISEKAAIIFLALLIVAAWGFAYEKFEATIDETVELSPGGTVSLENINGDVTIEVWDRDEVRVQAVKSASSQELLDGLKVEINASPSAVRIETDYPSSRSSRDEGHEHSKRGNHLQVEYTLTVPRSAVVDDVDLVNGNLLVVGVEGGVEAEAVNGNIVVREGAGNASLSTVNGGIELYVDRLGELGAVGTGDRQRIDRSLSECVGRRRHQRRDRQRGPRQRPRDRGQEGQVRRSELQRLDRWRRIAG